MHTPVIGGFAGRVSPILVKQREPQALVQFPADWYRYGAPLRFLA